MYCEIQTELSVWNQSVVKNGEPATAGRYQTRTLRVVAVVTVKDLEFSDNYWTLEKGP